MFSLKADYEKEEEKEFQLTLLEWRLTCEEIENQFKKKEKKKKIMYVLMSEKEYEKRDRKADVLQLKRVKSSSIIAIGYQKNFLYVMFNTHVVYRYTNVPLQTVADLFNEKVSIGKLFHETVKKSGYKYEKV